MVSDSAGHDLPQTGRIIPPNRDGNKVIPVWSAKRSRRKSVKKYLAVIAGVFVIGVAVFSVDQSNAQNAPTIPAWVHPGVTVIYDAVSAFVQNGRYTQGVQIVMTTRVNSVAGGLVNGVTNTVTVGSGIAGNHAWVCNAGGVCRGDATGINGQFWVDPASPAASKRGGNGETFSFMGSGPYTYNGKTWAASTISYQNPATGVQLMCVFETKSGLIIAYSETSPAQQVHTYLRSVSGI
jgi:hypothetical protein